MKTLLSTLFLLAIAAGVATADVPDPSYCSVMPGDGYDHPRFLGIPYADGDINYADIEITICAFGGMPIAGADVELVFNQNCLGLDGLLCICAAYCGTGTTDEFGEITFNLKVGGCCDESAAMTVLANDIPIRAWIFVSPDPGQPSQQGSDCAVDGVDFVIFNNTYASGPYGWCSDFNGDYENDGVDFTIFRGAWAKDCPPY